MDSPQSSDAAVRTLSIHTACGSGYSVAANYIPMSFFNEVPFLLFFQDIPERGIHAVD